MSYNNKVDKILQKITDKYDIDINIIKDKLRYGIKKKTGGYQ